MKRTLVCFIFLLLFVLTFENDDPYPVMAQGNDKPDFTFTNRTITDIQPGSGVIQLNATIQNTGNASATKGTVPISWEEFMVHIPLVGGVGTLNETEINRDCNGDGDQIDTFPITWEHNATRFQDATVDGKYVYGLWEGNPLSNLSENYRTYYINEKSKLFQLGTKTHALYYAADDYASFGLDSIIYHHPSPNLIFFVEGIDLNVAKTLNASDFRINGESVEVNYTHFQIVNYILTYGMPLWDDIFYIIPNQATEIDLEEKLNFSCTIKVNETIAVWFSLQVNWSPDGNRRDSWYTSFQDFPVSYLINKTMTTSTTSTTSTPGFSILTTLPLLFIIMVFIQKRRYK